MEVRPALQRGESEDRKCGPGMTWSADPLGGTREMMGFVFRYSWCFFILVGTSALLEIRAALGMSQRPRDLARPRLVANLPWLFMAMDAVARPARPTAKIFNFRQSWIGYGEVASTILLWLALPHWLFAKQGAERLAASPKLAKKLPRNPSVIKVLAIACVLGGAVGLVTAILASAQASP